jgi:hypothetical protein
MSESRIQGSQHNLVPETESSVNEIDSRKGRLSSEAQTTEAAGVHADYDKVMNGGLSEYLAKQPACDSSATSPAGSGQFGKAQAASDWLLKEGAFLRDGGAAQFPHGGQELKYNPTSSPSSWAPTKSDSKQNAGGGNSAADKIISALGSGVPAPTRDPVSGESYTITTMDPQPLTDGRASAPGYSTIKEVAGTFDEVSGQISAYLNLPLPPSNSAPTPKPPDPTPPTPPVPQDNVPVPTPAELAKQNAADAGDYVGPADAPTSAAASDPTSDVPDGGGGDASFDLGGTSPDKQP